MLGMIVAMTIGAAATPQACPLDFDPFLEQFAASAEAQRAAVAQAVGTSRVDLAGPEPRSIRRRADVADLQFPVMPLAEARRREGLVLTTRKSGPRAIVTLSKPDTDHLVEYRFLRVGCWRLVEINDRSL